MKKFNSLIFSGITALLLAGFSSSAMAGSCNGSTSCTGTVDVAYINSAGELFVRLTGLDIPAGTSCTASYNYGRVDPGHSQFKNFYAMVLTAYSLQSDISLRMVNDSAACDIQYITMK